MNAQDVPFPQIWPQAPRYCPARAFPAYRFLPGVTAHPRQDSKGHSYGREEEIVDYRPPERWCENELYLFGIDLYHHGYLWESHEVWETLWHLADKESPEGQFLQGLIQNAAAALKVHLKQWNAARHLSRESRRRMQFISNAGLKVFMGLDVEKLCQDMDAYYDALWRGEDKTSETPPRLKLIAFNP